MAGVATLAMNLKVTGLGSDIEVSNSQTLTVPVEVLQGYTLTDGATATAIELLAGITNIPLANVYGVWIKAEVGTIYITVQTDGTDGTTYGLTTTADMTLLVGESCFIPHNWNKTGVAGILVGGSVATAAFSWVILGKA